MAVCIALSLSPSSAFAAATKTIKDKYLSVTYPTQVKLPKSGCSSFTIKYTWGSATKRYAEKYYVVDYPFSQITAGFALENGYDYGALVRIAPTDRGPWTSSVKMKYCRSDWVLNNTFLGIPQEEDMVGMDPGIHTLRVLYIIGQQEEDGRVFEANIRFVR
jgi:hypothetical protein